MAAERAAGVLGPSASAGDDHASVCATGELIADNVYCDACGARMKPMGHCKYWCLTCGFLRTCNDVM